MRLVHNLGILTHLKLRNKKLIKFREKFTEFTKPKNPNQLKNDISVMNPISLYTFNNKWLAPVEEWNTESYESDYLR